MKIQALTSFRFRTLHHPLNDWSATAHWPRDTFSTRPVGPRSSTIGPILVRPSNFTARATEATPLVVPRHVPETTVQSTPRHLADLIGKPPKLVLLLDYDGTLMENSNWSTSTASEPLKVTLQRLASHADIEVVVVSGRDHALHVKAVPEGLGVHRIANHGADFLRAGGAAWETLVADASLEWKAITEDAMLLFTSQNPGTELEKKSRGAVLHFEDVANPEEVKTRVKDFVRDLRDKLQWYDVKVELGSNAVEVRESSADKGLASRVAIEKLLGKNLPAGTMIVAAGDADTDEGMFKTFAKHTKAVTIRVGPGESGAHWRLSAPAQVRELLGLIANTYR